MNHRKQVFCAPTRPGIGRITSRYVEESGCKVAVWLCLAYSCMYRPRPNLVCLWVVADPEGPRCSLGLIFTLKQLKLRCDVKIVPLVSQSYKGGSIKGKTLTDSYALFMLVPDNYHVVPADC